MRLSELPLSTNNLALNPLMLTTVLDLVRDGGGGGGHHFSRDHCNSRIT